MDRRVATLLASNPTLFLSRLPTHPSSSRRVPGSRTTAACARQRPCSTSRPAEKEDSHLGTGGAALALEPVEALLDQPDVAAQRALELVHARLILLQVRELLRAHDVRAWAV